MLPTVSMAILSFDEWASRTGLWRDIRRLESLQLIEAAGRSGKPDIHRVIRLTEQGRRMALGGIVPPDHWDRAWDGKWRFVVFDIPESERAKRRKLRTWLHARRFGAMQRSVWISPDPLSGFAGNLRADLPDCRAFAAIEGMPCLGENPSDMVAGAWDFNRVDEAYARWKNHADVLGTVIKLDRRKRLLAWGDRECKLWADCMDVDPLLPRQLWPKGYAGEKSWTLRMKVLAKAVRAFDVESTA